ncbi:hypothetical protein NRIC_09220 [Enterococcus florum]|uniref:SHOCT domain-containing protein n=1 Tax=Enterococcus florum TaxID=2480627 RepID=A0A4P5P9X8_9ENTE|nr:hypothetical protein [Enterococcus florum]GCF93031.1 hypothetical protein NRIC_09220 [Enterococcus florum]
MKGETICWFCEEPLKMLTTVKLIDDRKICNDCHSEIKQDLNLGLFNSKKITIDDIIQGYEDLDRDIEAEFEELRSMREDIKNTGIFLQVDIDIASGASAIGVSDKATLFQLNDNRIVLNLKYPQFYYLLSTDFDGPTYKTVFDSSSSGTSTTDSRTKTKKKGKTGRVAAGALIGSALLPGVGTVVGAYAGSKGKDKKKKKEKSRTDHDIKTTETTQEIEVKSLAKIVLYSIFDEKTITLTLNADTKDYNELLSLQPHQLDDLEDNVNINENEDGASVSREEAISKLKEIKELVDLGILSNEEFEEKKKLYMKHI